MAHLRRSPSLFFTPLPPSNLRPFGAPPSIGRREYPREPLPLEGAAERSEAGLASFFGGEAASSLPFPLGKALRREKRYPRIATFPLGEGGPRSGARVLSQTAHLRRSPSLSFIPLFPSNLRPFPWKGLPSAARRGWLPFWAAKPPPLCLSPWERRCVEKSGILLSPPSPRGEGFAGGGDCFSTHASIM